MIEWLKGKWPWLLGLVGLGALVVEKHGESEGRKSAEGEAARAVLPVLEHQAQVDAAASRDELAELAAHALDTSKALEGDPTEEDVRAFLEDAAGKR